VSCNLHGTRYWGRRKQFCAPYIRLGAQEARNVGGHTAVVHFGGPPCRTLDDMSDDEIRAIEQQYGAEVRR